MIQRLLEGKTNLEVDRDFHRNENTITPPILILSSVCGIRPPARFSDLQARIGLRSLDDFDEILAVLKKQFCEIQQRIDYAGMGPDRDQGGCVNGFMTVGMCKDAALLSRKFFKHGIDFKINYMRDCLDTISGLGAEHCNPLAKHIFHIPNRTGFSEACFKRYTAQVGWLFQEPDMRL